MVSEVPALDLLSAIGALMVFLRREGVTDRQAQLRLVDDFCVGDTKRIASALVRDRWLFLAPQPLLAVAKLALVAGDPSRVRPGADEDPNSRRRCPSMVSSVTSGWAAMNVSVATKLRR